MTLKNSKIILNCLDDSIQSIEKLKTQQVLIEKIFNILEKTKKNGNNIFICGNGGSASTASHMLCDLNKTSSMTGKKRFRTISLTDNIPIITALGNDIKYDDIFVEQLKNFFNPSDVLLIISGSGNSSNVIKAAKYAKNKKGKVIGFTGFNGGKLKTLCDECIIIPANSMYRIEDLHLMLNHILVTLFRGGKDYK